MIVTIFVPVPDSSWLHTIYVSVKIENMRQLGVYDLLRDKISVHLLKADSENFVTCISNSGAESFEGIDIPVSLILCFENQSQCLRQPEDLQELQTKRQEDTRPYQQYQERRSPYKTIDRIQQFKIQIHFFVSLQESKINKKAGFSNKK